MARLVLFAARALNLFGLSLVLKRDIRLTATTDGYVVCEPGPLRYSVALTK